jgi:hypothetical protein
MCRLRATFQTGLPQRDRNRFATLPVSDLPDQVFGFSAQKNTLSSGSGLLPQQSRNRAWRKRQDPQEHNGQSRLAAHLREGGGEAAEIPCESCAAGYRLRRAMRSASDRGHHRELRRIQAGEGGVRWVACGMPRNRGISETLTGGCGVRKSRTCWRTIGQRW